MTEKILAVLNDRLKMVSDENLEEAIRIAVRALGEISNEEHYCCGRADKEECPKYLPKEPSMWCDFCRCRSALAEIARVLGCQ